MKVDWMAQLQKRFGDALLRDLPLAPLTTLRVGGRARGALTVTDVEELRDALQVVTRAGVPFLILGKGANLIVPDEGFPGLVIQLKGVFETIRVTRKTAKAGYVKAGAGVVLSDLLAFALHAGLSGLEPLTGIPATVGGAVRMNAGIPGFSIAEALSSVTLLRSDGSDQKIRARALRPTYRDMCLPRGSVVLEGVFRLSVAAPEVIREKTRAYQKKRRAQTWRRYPNAGSIFRNPPGTSAGRLIDACGLKGARSGGAQISPEHANVIVNLGNATAGDVLALIELARETVREKTGVALKLEVVIAGN